jgi:16S rRNA (cytosine1402-N4)-methyltransferase
LRRGGKVIGIDQDPDAIAEVGSKLARFTDGRLEIVQANFRRIAQVVKAARLAENGLVDGVIMDLGISSHQIDVSTRGFAFAQDGPLDMRMSQGEGPEGVLTAATIVNTWTEESISNLLFDYGEEPRARRLARSLVACRPLETTGALKDVINQNTHFNFQTKTLARCFQALRIAVNDEMLALEDALTSLHEVVRPGGRLVVMSYHSLEDRPVKRLLNSGQLSSSASKAEVLYWKPVGRKAVVASPDELALNNRARSAKMRVGERIDAVNISDLEYLPGRERKSKYMKGQKGAKQRKRAEAEAEAAAAAVVAVE